MTHHLSDLFLLLLLTLEVGYGFRCYARRPRKPKFRQRQFRYGRGALRSPFCENCVTRWACVGDDLRKQNIARLGRRNHAPLHPHQRDRRACSS